MPPQVATKVSISTKILVTTLFIAGLGALGYASGFVKLDYQSARGVSDAALEECDCLHNCADSRQECLDAGLPAEKCDYVVGVCIDECLPKDTCEDSCGDSYKKCKKSGGSEEECTSLATSCMCECDPYFAPPNVDNRCVDSCAITRAQCEESMAKDPKLGLDCVSLEAGCLRECKPWCDDKGGSSTTDDSCEDSCDVTYDECLANQSVAAAIDCQGQRDGCLRECPDDSSTKTGDSCEDQCRPTYEDCKANGGDEAECVALGAACLCECDPLFAPKDVDNSCVVSCLDARPQCEADAASNPTAAIDCDGREDGCLRECHLWCDDQGGTITNSNTRSSCDEVCEEDYDQCLVSSVATANLDCQGLKDSCLRECEEDGGDGTDGGGSDGTNPGGDSTGDDTSCIGMCDDGYQRCLVDGGLETDCRAAKDSCALDCDNVTHSSDGGVTADGSGGTSDGHTSDDAAAAGGARR